MLYDFKEVMISVKYLILQIDLNLKIFFVKMCL